MEESLKIEKDPIDDSTEVLAEDYDMEIEMLKSTRDNFLIWKDYDY